MKDESIWGAIMMNLLFISVFSAFSVTAKAQAASYYWVTVSPYSPSPLTHSTVDFNWSISFLAMWTYGSNLGMPVANANVTVDVTITNDTEIETLFVTTNETGFFSFYYSSATPGILTFLPAKLVTEDQVEWNSSLLQNGADYLYGFRSEPITIYWDTFDISLLTFDTSIRAVTKVSVNIAYLLVPDEGLVSLGITKNVHGANVTINGIRAEESSTSGIYSTELSTWLPTANILVIVSQEGWTQADKAFNQIHAPNETVWVLAVGLASAVAVGIFFFVFFRKKEKRVALRELKSPILGAILLLIASLFTTYWALVGLEGFLHGFDWMLLGVFGIASCIFGFSGSLMSKRRRHFTFTIIAVCFPMMENAIVVEYSFHNYGLAIPWVAVAAASLIVIVGGILIGRSDEQFAGR